jgi:hypothetical protein
MSDMIEGIESRIAVRVKRPRGRPRGKEFSELRSFSFTPEDLELLAGLAHKAGVSQAGVLRQLIRQASKARD